MNPSELLQYPLPTLSLQFGAPWRTHNLRIVAAGEDRDGPFVTIEAIAPEKNGHMEQWCDHVETISWPLTVSGVLSSDTPEKFGVNVYLHTDAGDPGKPKVYQLEHPGDGSWHKLERKIPAPAQPIQRVRVLVVVRTGAGPVRLRSVSLRQTVATNSFVADLLEREHISVDYYDAVMAMVSKHPAASDGAFRDKLAGYLLRSNRKGMETVGVIKRLCALEGKSVEGARLLDVGSGSGGVLVGALKAGATGVEGWEVNVEKIELSKINVRTCGIDADRARILARSAEAAADDVEPFDVVVCEDVLEHVKDIEAAVATLARCIAPNGLGYITIPNGYAFNNVLADPHLELYGISLLDRFEAQPLATALKNHTHYAAMMGAYYRHGDYVELFRRHGLELSEVESVPAEEKELKGLFQALDAIARRHQSLRDDWADRVEEETLTLLDKRLGSYLAEARSRQEEVSLPGASKAVRESFIRDYGRTQFVYTVRRRDDSTG